LDKNTTDDITVKKLSSEEITSKFNIVLDKEDKLYNDKFNIYE
jgi:hypothetical protein